jgi:hypothetical protein
VGFAAGRYLPFGKYTQHDPVLFFSAFSEPGWKMTEESYNHNAKDAKQLLLTTLSIGESDIQQVMPEQMKKALVMRSALTKARLAVLEREAGNYDQAKDYLAKAEADLKAIGWKDYSDAAILKAIKRPHDPSN